VRGYAKNNMSLRLYNTLTRKKELFRPRTGKTVSLYTCGPTVYNFVHIGNLRTYVFEDFLKRTLQAQGWRVNHVMNITDVGHLTDDADNGDDKIERAATAQAMSAWDLAAFYTRAFEHDIARLNILPPTRWCKATDYIAEQIALIKKLEARGFTYRLEDGVYFDTSKFPTYGSLAHLNLKGQKASARIEMIQGKRSPSDFALWKFSGIAGKRQMEWLSPWGIGFPGWHIECSAMSMALLKTPIDIHCGGIDHIPVHHTNEIAQSEAATGRRPFVRVWMHGAFLTIKAGKMAKSEGNFLTLTTLLEQGVGPLSYRYLLTTAHYRKALDFSMESLHAAHASYQRLKNILEQRSVLATPPAKRPSSVAKGYWKKFLSGLNDDINLPEAMAVLWRGVRDRQLNTNAASLRWFIEQTDTVLGLDLCVPTSASAPIPSDIQILIEQRDHARHNKQWQRADDLRQVIERAGYHIQDSPSGARVIFRSPPAML